MTPVNGTRAFCMLGAGLICVLAVAAEAAAANADQCEDAHPASGVCKCKVTELHPTQIAVGMLEVRERAKNLPENEEQLDAALRKKPAKVVWGGGGKLYVYDGHHLAAAALHNSIKRIHCDVTDDLSGLSLGAFWARMEQDKRVYPVDAKGRRQPFSDIPSTVGGLTDDRYRSLAWLVKKGCGFQKTAEPFAEFQWAEFFRVEVAIESKRRHDIEAAVDDAIALAQSSSASHLPGFCGKHCICDGST